MNKIVVTYIHLFKDNSKYLLFQSFLTEFLKNNVTAISKHREKSTIYSSDIKLVQLHILKLHNFQITRKYNVLGFRPKQF